MLGEIYFVVIEKHTLVSLSRLLSNQNVSGVDPMKISVKLNTIRNVIPAAKAIWESC